MTEQLSEGFHHPGFVRTIFCLRLSFMSVSSRLCSREMSSHVAGSASPYGRESSRAFLRTSAPEVGFRTWINGLTVDDDGATGIGASAERVKINPSAALVACTGAGESEASGGGSSRGGGDPIRMDTDCRPGEEAVSSGASAASCSPADSGLLSKP